LIVAPGKCWLSRELAASAVALEDTLDVDVSSARQDWLNGTDAYLRR